MKRFLECFNKSTERNKQISPFAIVSTVVLACVVAFFVFTNDSGGIEALKWISAVLGVAIIARNVLPVECLQTWDNGFGISFGLGFAVMFLVTWFVPAMGLTFFNTLLIYVFVIVAIVLEIVYLVFFDRNRQFTRAWSNGGIERFISGYAVFVLLFFVAFWVIGFNALLDHSTENYMDFGFMQSIYRQQEVAPWDIWFSGQKLNYYYLGQAAATYLCRLAFTTPEYGYNFMLATFWSMVFVMSGEIAYGIVSNTHIHDESQRITKYAPIISAITASLMASFAANGHWIVFGIVVPIIQKVRGIGESASKYWFPEATVYISTSLGDVDNGKNEFPAYSVILGDLHAHVINVIFVLPLVALLIDYALTKDEKKNYKKLIIISMLLGLYKGSNFWDFAIYFVITGAVVVFCDISKKGFGRLAIVGIVKKALLVIVVSTIVVLPFTLQFVKMSSHAMIANAHSPFNKMAILWGIPFSIVIIFLIDIYVGKNKKTIFENELKAGLSAIILCTFGLVMTPEFVYILDIYGEENARFNTMFKLTYQAFVLFAILIGVAAGFTFRNVKSLFLVIAVIVVLSSSYTLHAVNDWMGNVFDNQNRGGISTLEGLRYSSDYCYEVMANDILKSDNRKVLNILEAAGDSYTHDCALSVMSGTCTPVGWFVHEWMWRNDSYSVGERSEEVRSFYESGDEVYCLDFIEKYNINYIFVGPVECSRYLVNMNGFANLGTTVWSSDDNGNDMRLIFVK